MVLIPIPVIRSIGIGGLLIPVVSVLRRHHVPAGDVVAARAADQLRPRDAEADRRGHRRGARASGGGGRTSSCVTRSLIGGIGSGDRRLPDDSGVQLNAGEAQAKDLAGPATDDAVDWLATADRRRHLARRAQALRRARRAESVATLPPRPSPKGSRRQTGIAGAAAPRRLASGARRSSSRRSLTKTAPQRLVQRHDLQAPGRRAACHRARARRRHAADARRHRARGSRLRARGLREVPLHAHLRRSC